MRWSEVSVETNNYSAELGNVAGAVVNMVIKSGTNQFRGNGFYYLRDNELAATPWATNRASAARRPNFTQRHVWRHDRRADPPEQVVLLRQLPGRRQYDRAEPELRDGGARRVAAGRPEQPAARNIIIRDPLTGQAFPNNQIPANRFSQFARNLFADETLYPRANVARPMSGLPRELSPGDRAQSRTSTSTT